MNLIKVSLDFQIIRFAGFGKIRKRMALPTADTKKGGGYGSVGQLGLAHCDCEADRSGRSVRVDGERPVNECGCAPVDDSSR